MPLQHTVVLERRKSQRTSAEKIRQQIAYVVRRALGGNRGTGWECRPFRVPEPVKEGAEWVQHITLTFTKVGRQSKKPDVEKRQWYQIVRFMVLACQNAKFARSPWNIIKGIEGVPLDEDEPDEHRPQNTEDVVKNYGQVSLDRGTHFDHLYDLDAQIQIIYSALETAAQTDFNKRCHCVLFGEPGCGKTELMRAFGRMVGQENEAYMLLDATSTTEAGAAKLLLDSAVVPPLLLVEEIEKTDEKSLRWLLGVLDHRAEIRRTNFRIGNKAKNVKMLCICTVNDIGLFQKVMSEALASRFPNQIYFPRPNEDVMRKILDREVRSIRGDPRWIEPAIEHCMHKKGITDPRRVITFCLCGKGKLLTGEYQEAWEATQMPRDLAKQLGRG